MLTVIPVSSADAGLIDPFSRAVRHFGTNPGYDALIVARPSDAEHAKKLHAEIQLSFDNVTVSLFDQDGPTGWPLGPNFYWKSTIHMLRQAKNKSPWLWLELDSTPLKSGWLSALNTEYNLTGKPFMGVIEKTHATSPEGVPVNAGMHLVGVAIYPPDISLYSTLWPFVAAMPKPFDVVCQWEFVKHSHDTKLMQHCFRTQKYSRSKEGEIRGEDHNGFPNGIRFDNPLSPTAVLHHGCDDGSLSELMVSPDGDPPPPANVVQMPLPGEADKIPEKFRAELPVDAEALIPTPRRKVRY